MSKNPELYWHFLPDDGRLRFGEPRKKVVTDRTLRITETPILCERGFHASRKAIDALKYAPGALICRVTLGGEIVEDSDKFAAQERTVIWKADATNVLHEFACWCAEQALRTAKVNDQRCWAAIETKRKWLRGEATEQELHAASAAARAAARDAQNDKLESMLLALKPKKKGHELMTPEQRYAIRCHAADLRNAESNAPAWKVYPRASADYIDALLVEVESLTETLRDRFAMAALTGLIGHNGKGGDVAAECAYAIADAMLAAREKATHGAAGPDA